MSSTEKHTSLRTKLIVTIAFCWVLPIILVAATGLVLLNRNYTRSMHQELELAGDFAINQTLSRFETVLFESKTVSYDGVVRSAYRTYTIDGDQANLYRTVTNYLKQHFSRRDSVDAAFLSIWNEPGLMPYVCNQGEDPSRQIREAYMTIEPLILSDMAEADTAIRLYSLDGLLYAARNLLDSRMQPYATIVLSCNVPYLTAPLASLNLIGPAWGEIDQFFLSDRGQLMDAAPTVLNEKEFVFSGEAEGHQISLHAHLRRYDLFSDAIEMPALLICVMILVLVLLASILRFFSKQVSQPVQTLVEANQQVENGKRGYLITSHADSHEFDVLFKHFNSMSGELEKQFNLALEEQKALHQARIKALQSQINPHFLNNTLEIINWESRIAGNDQVTAMIEALATMLNTSLNRNDSPMITFEEEMSYTEAYLYIIKQRMGEKLSVQYEVDSSLNGRQVPRMILQPLVENAVEHDLSRSAGGTLTIRAFQENGRIYLQAEHNGHILLHDRKKLDRLLQPDNNEPGDRVHIGVRNVSQRLRLLYNESAYLRVEEVSDGLIRAEISLPVS